MPWNYEELKRLVAGESLPCMVVDLDALDANTRRLADVAERAGKRLRIASKSVRVPDLLRRMQEVGGDHVRGLMCFSPAEAAYLHGEGFDDLLLAYPSVQPSDLEILWDLRRQGGDVSLMIDSPAHAARLDAWWAARSSGESDAPTLPVCIDADMSYRPLDRMRRAAADALHLGVRRSPVRDADRFREVVLAIKAAPRLALRGVMGYEAQIAGLGETNPFTPTLNPVKRLLKQRSTVDVARKRETLTNVLLDEGFTVGPEPGQVLFNGGGTGSIRTTTQEPWITEVTAGSGFLQSHLFDYYADNANEPAFTFGLQVTRVPQPGYVTCQSGGFVASGETAPDKSPVVFLPEGTEPTKTEGFGEVQTPLKVPPGVDLDLGDPVFCRPAKAGEIAERFDEYILKRGPEIVGRARTYRGLGRCFY